MLESQANLFVGRDVVLFSDSIVYGPYGQSLAKARQQAIQKHRNFVWTAIGDRLSSHCRNHCRHSAPFEQPLSEPLSEPFLESWPSASGGALSLVAWIPWCDRCHDVSQWYKHSTVIVGRLSFRESVRCA